MDKEIQKLLNLANEDKNHSSVSFAERFFPDLKESEKAFLALKTKVCDVAAWNQSGALNSFNLYDESGDECGSSLIAENLFIRISMKGSGKYDWVRVAQIADRENAVIITVRPTYDPTEQKIDKTRISHFFTAEANNNFCLQKEANFVRLHVIGLDEKQNTSETQNMLEIVRNVATANLGSYLGIQEEEWKTFCTNMLGLYKPGEIHHRR